MTNVRWMFMWVNLFEVDSVTRINNQTLMRHLGRPIRWSRRKDPCRVYCSWLVIINKNRVKFRRICMEWSEHIWARPLVACENIRFSSLFAAGDVSRGGTIGTLRTQDAVGRRGGQKWLFQFRMKSACAWRFLPLSRTRPEDIWRRLENVSI